MDRGASQATVHSIAKESNTTEHTGTRHTQFINLSLLVFIPSSALVTYTLFDDGLFDWCEVIPHCSFDLHFSIISHGEHILMYLLTVCGLPWWLSNKEPTCQRRRCGFDPGVRKIHGEGNGNPLQYSCLENPMDRGAWQALVYGVTRVRQDLVD